MTKKIEMTKEQAESIFEQATNGDEQNRLFLHAAARVLYGTPQKLDRVEIAKGFMVGILANPATPEETMTVNDPVIMSFGFADAFIAFAEEGGEG